MKIADMHCDTISKIWESRNSGSPQGLCRNSLHVDIRKMKASGYLLQNFAMYIDLQKGNDPFAYVLELIDVFYDEMAKNKNDIRPVKSYADILENEKQGKISALMTIEEGGCCKGDLENLETLYRLGARMMTLTWNYPNELAGPNHFNGTKKADGSRCPGPADGLTKKGFAFVERMEDLGMIIDVSHLSDAGFRDVLSSTEKPFVASHSNARALCGHARNLTDDMIRALADRGGVIGLNYYGRFLSEKDGSRSTVAGMAEHARHILNVGGRGCLGLGSDFDGIDGDLEIRDCSRVHRLADELEHRRFTYEEIDGILHGNVMRVYRELLR